MEIHILLAGVEIGPFSEKQVRQYLADGLVSPSDPAKIAGTDTWDDVDIVLGKLPATPSAKPRVPGPPTSSARMEKTPATPILSQTPSPPEPERRPVRAILKTPAFSPESPKDSFVTATTVSPAPIQASAPELEAAAAKAPPTDSPASAVTQKSKRKPAKIVLQPMLPLSPVPLSEGKVQALPRVDPPAQETESPRAPVDSSAPPIKKMVAVKAIVPTQPPPLKKITVRKETPSLPAKPAPETKVEAKPVPNPERELELEPVTPVAPVVTTEPVVTAQPAPPPSKKRPVRTETFAPIRSMPNIGAIAGVVAIVLLGGLTFGWFYHAGSNSASNKTATAAPDSDDVLLAGHPTTADTFNKRGAVRQSKGNIDGAIADYDQAITLESNNVLAYYQRGLARETKNDWKGALEDFNHALVLDPRHAETYSNRGFVKQTQGDLDGAIADYTQALFINPNIAIAYYNRGLIKGMRGDADGAVADYTQALTLNPKIALVYYNRGLIRQQRGDLDGAIMDFNHTLELNPKMALAYYYRGNAKNSENNSDGAIIDYTRAIGLDPKMAAAYGYRGSARQNKGDLDGALDDYTQALTLNPKLAAAYFNRGLIRQQKGDLDGAIADSTQALQLDPKDAQSYCNRGLDKLGKGDLDGALVDLKTFCQLAPRDPAADYVRLYLWLISTKENPQGHADADLTAALAGDWNSPPDNLATKISKYLLGHASEADLLDIANDTTQDTSTRCKIYYFVGMKRLFAGQKSTAIDYFQKAIAVGKPDCCEFFFAQQELREQGITPAGAPVSAGTPAPPATP